MLQIGLMTAYDVWAGTSHDNLPSVDEKVAKLRLHMNHLAFAHLEGQGVVKWDKNSRVMIEGPNFDEKETEVLVNE